LFFPFRIQNHLYLEDEFFMFYILTVLLLFLVFYVTKKALKNRNLFLSRLFVF